ncbi:MAG: AAA family ATPase [Pirellulaceae bacterium]|nr:AAA family ATPase [Pirellulaceae bacterium]
MYESFFQLSHRPFAAAPTAEAFVATRSADEARQTLIRTVERAEGPGLVIGPPGTGKSLLCQVLARHFVGRFHLAHLAGARLATRRALLQNILFELKLPYRGLDENELRLSLIDHLEPGEGSGEGLLLLVDEAHSLPLRLLEEIRLITNLVRDGQPRVRLILAGGMALEERLASPKLESFHQRIATRCYLQPLTRDETASYVEEKLRRAGADPGQLFTLEALRAIHTATDGIPRLVNQLCDHALMLAAVGGHRQLGPEGIEEAWADLQQLPAPWHEPARPAPASAATGVIEFGQLSDEAFRSAVGEQAVARLDAITSGINHLREEEEIVEVGQVPVEGEPDDFSPADERGTEVELIFHQAHDPFGGGWEQEEVVIDRYASFSGAGRPHVFTSEGPQIHEALVAAAQPTMPKLAEVAAPAIAPRPATIAEQVEVSATFDPANDPLLPEDEAAPVAATRRATISLRDLVGDDRDLIVIEEEQQAPPRRAPLAGRVRRPEYRQLFSNLRNRS